MVPGSKQNIHNIGKVVGTSENVSKTEMTNYKNKALSVTSAKLHDGIDFDQSTSNDMVASTLSNDRKASTYGNMYKGLSTQHTVQDLSIQSSINTSPTNTECWSWGTAIKCAIEVANGVGE